MPARIRESLLITWALSLACAPTVNRIDLVTPHASDGSRTWIVMRDADGNDLLFYCANAVEFDVPRCIPVLVPSEVLRPEKYKPTVKISTPTDRWGVHATESAPAKEEPDMFSLCQRACDNLRALAPERFRTSGWESTERCLVRCLSFPEGTARCLAEAKDRTALDGCK